MNRKEFLTLFTGILSGLGIPGVVEGSGPGVQPERSKQPASGLDDSYLAKGLTAMARAEGWFEAHWGAGVLAGYYLCRDNQLEEPTIAGIKKQLDTVIQLRASQFEPLPEQEADAALIEEVPRALPPAMEGGLRAHGHAVIFASLSTRALHDAPRMAIPAIIEGLCSRSRQISRLAPQKPSGSEPFHYPDTQAMIEATFDSLARFRRLLGHPSIRRPNFTHMTTHTEALMNLEMMGYSDLAKAGHSGLRTHTGAPVPEVDKATPETTDPASLEGVMSEGFWDDEENQDRWRRPWDATDNPNGYWIAEGHLFKVLYSYHRLIQRIPDKEKVALCSRILFERYMNPEVQGG